MKSLAKSLVGKISTTTLFLIIVIIFVLILRQAGIVRAQNESDYEIVDKSDVFMNLEIRGDTVRTTLTSDNGTLLENKQIDFYLNDSIMGSGLTNSEGFVDFPINDKGTLKAVFNGDSYINPSEGEAVLNVTSENIIEGKVVPEKSKKDDISAEFEQGEAEINKPVRWVKKIKKDLASDIKSQIPEKAFDATTNEANEEIVIEYFTEAPKSYENIINNYKKTVTVSSDFNYTNIKTYTDITESKKDSIRLYWFVDDSKIDVTSDSSINLTFYDTNNNGLIDRLEWITPHTSNQTFEISIIVLNPYTYVRNGENWTVAFDASGEADLVINSTNANWTEFLADDPDTKDEMRLLDISCGGNSLKNSLELIDENENYYNYSQLNESDSIRIKKLLIRNYACDGTGYITNNMLIAGYAALQFTFGDQVAYAYDAGEPLYSQNSTNNTYVGGATKFSLKWTDNGSLHGYNLALDNCTGTLANQSFKYFGRPNAYSEYEWGADIDNGNLGYDKNFNDTTTWATINITEGLNSGSITYNFTNVNVGRKLFYTWANKTKASIENSAAYPKLSVLNFTSNMYDDKDTTCGDWSGTLKTENWTITSDYVSNGRLSLKFSGYLGVLNFTVSDVYVDTNESWSNETFIINSTANCQIRWCYYANDTLGNKNNSCGSPFTFNTTEATPPTYARNTTNTTTAGQPCNFSLEWNDSVALNNNGKWIFSTNNSGTWRNYTLTDVLVPDIAINKGYNSTQSTADSNPNSASNSLDDSRYSKVNTSDNNEFYFGSLSGGGNAYTHYRWTFNLSNYDINALTSICYGVEGFYQASTGGYGMITTKNMSSGNWIDINNMSQTFDVNTTKCYNSSAYDLSQFINSTDNTFQIATTANASGGGQSLVYIDYVEANISNLTKFTATPQNATWALTLNSTAGTKVAWCFYAKDNAGNWNSTNCQNDNTYFYVTTTEITPPQWVAGSNSTNTTSIGLPANFTLNWTDNYQLAGYIFSTNNTGAWSNSSYVTFSGATNTSWNVTALNSTAGTKVAWCYYANDTYGNMNGTNCQNDNTYFYVTTTEITPPQWVAGSNSTSTTSAGLPCNFSLGWNDSVALNNNGKWIFSTNNSGTWRNYTATTLSVPDSVINLGYKTAQSVPPSQSEPGNATTLIDSSELEAIRLSDSNNVDFTSTSSYSGQTNYTHYRWTFNLSKELPGYNVNDITSICYRVEGYYTTNEACQNACSGDIRTKNASSGLWIDTIALNEISKANTTECYSSSSYNLSQLINSTSGTFEIAATASSTYHTPSGVVSVKLDYMEINVTMNNDNRSNNFITTPQNATYVLTLNTTVGKNVAWCYYAKDNVGNWNGTNCQSGNQFTITTTENFNLVACSVLNTAGATYNLTADINDSAATYCMNISANNITLDCQGHLIDGVDTSSTYGVYIYRAAATNTNITVKNCNVTDWTYGNYLYYSQNNTLTNNTANSNLYGFTLTSSSNNTFTNNTASSNGYGFSLTSSSNNTLTNNTASSTSEGSGFALTSSSNNILTNNTASSTAVGHGFYLSSSSNNTFTNNMVNSNGYGFFLTSSSNNTFTNNTASSNGYGFYLYANSNNNAITGGSIALSATNDYYLQGTGSTNNFTSTNFTASRKIYFYDATSWFNYQNTSGSLWLKTNVSAAATLTRLLLSWQQTNITWNETSSASVTGNYNLTGLLSSTAYSVKNSTDTYFVQTDASGKLKFESALTTTTQTISVATETTPPQWITGSNATNTTVAGVPCNFTLNWNDNYQLAGYIFSTNNSGTWVNSSYIAFIGTTNTSWNITTLNSTLGTIVGWCFYANDTYGNMNNTNCLAGNEFYLNTTEANASFTVRLPDNINYSSSTSGGSTADEEFNATASTIANVSPCIRGAAQCQTQLIANFIVNNTGNVNENITICLNQSLSSKFAVWGTLTNNPYNGVNIIPNCSYSAWKANESLLINAVDEFWIWTNFTGVSVSDSTNRTLYINATQSGM